MSQVVHPKGHISIGRYMTAILRYVSAKMPAMVSNKSAPLYEDLGFVLPEFKHVASYPVLGGSFTGDVEIVDVPIPALLLDMERIVPAEEQSTGQLSVTFEMAAYIVMGKSLDKSNLLVRMYALGVAAILHQAKYGAPVGPARIADIVPVPHLRSQDHDYIAWVVRFNQDAYIGFIDDVCLDSDFGVTETPSEVFLGFDPKTGTEFEHVYERVVLNAKSD